VACGKIPSVSENRWNPLRDFLVRSKPNAYPAMRKISQKNH
jgi:hypothetical protein